MNELKKLLLDVEDDPSKSENIVMQTRENNNQQFNIFIQIKSILTTNFLIVYITSQTHIYGSRWDMKSKS